MGLIHFCISSTKQCLAHNRCTSDVSWIGEKWCPFYPHLNSVGSCYPWSHFLLTWCLFILDPWPLILEMVIKAGPRALWFIMCRLCSLIWLQDQWQQLPSFFSISRISSNILGHSIILEISLMISGLLYV